MERHYGYGRFRVCDAGYVRVCRPIMWVIDDLGAPPGLVLPGWVFSVDNQTSSQSETKNPTPPRKGGMGHPLM
jgi:hypothetical protein